MDLATMRAAVKAQGGADTALDDGTVDQWLNEGYVQLVERSQWLREIRTLTTVAGQRDYALEEGIVDLASLRVGGAPFTKLDIEDIWDLDVGDSRLLGAHGGFAANFGSTGEALLSLWPTPDTSGLLVELLTAQSPTLLSDASDVPRVPVGFHQAIVDFAIGTMLMRIDEDQQAAAGYFLKFEGTPDQDGRGGAVGRLSRRRRSRVGSGPAQARLSSYGWR